jgi:5-methylcytosine-specific restriction endonuclease McrA
MARIRRRWFLEKPEKRRSYRQQRRALESGAQGSWTGAEWLALIELWGGRCAYCGRETRLLTVDHRIPLSRGGSNSIENILPSCHVCNARKRTRTEEEFRLLLSSSSVDQLGLAGSPSDG